MKNAITLIICLTALVVCHRATAESTTNETEINP